MENQNVVVELSSEDALLFKFLQKNYENIKTLKECGVFEIKSKTIYLHIDQKCNIKRVDVLVRKL